MKSSQERTDRLEVISDAAQRLGLRGVYKVCAGDQSANNIRRKYVGNALAGAGADQREDIEAVGRAIISGEFVCN